MKTNDYLQWTGTFFLLSMYSINSFLPHLHPLNILSGVLGGLCFLIWTIRVDNKPQMIVNSVALMIGISGLLLAITSK